jgi:hypothetical protein
MGRSRSPLDGGTSATDTIASGTPASYNLTVTPGNNFSGTVVLNCTAIAAAQYATCSLLPSSVTLSGAAQNAVATLNTVTEAVPTRCPRCRAQRSFGGTALSLLFPALIFTWKARTSRHKAWRRDGPIVGAIFSAILLLIVQRMRRQQRQLQPALLAGGRLPVPGDRKLGERRLCRSRRR